MILPSCGGSFNPIDAPLVGYVLCPSANIYDAKFTIYYYIRKFFSVYYNNFKIL